MMQLTSRERILLSLLLVVGIIGVSYFYIFIPQTAHIELLRNQVATLQNDKVQMDRQITDKESIKLEYETKMTSYFELTNKLRPTIIQEKIVENFEDVLASCGISGKLYNFAFDEVGLKADDANAEAKRIVDLKSQYLLLNNMESIDSKISLLEGLQATLSFTTSYDNFVKLIDALDKHQYFMMINQFQFSTGDTTQVNVSMNIKFPAYPKLDESKDSKYIE